MQQQALNSVTSHGVSGGVRTILRLEGAAIFIAATFLYHQFHPAWSQYFWLFFLPDIGMLGYLAGPRIGSFTYNLLHSYCVPMVGGIGLLIFGDVTFLPLVFIWVAHIGFDRAAGYGLKYATSFGDTHLGKIGKWKRH